MDICLLEYYKSFARSLINDYSRLEIKNNMRKTIAEFPNKEDINSIEWLYEDTALAREYLKKRATKKRKSFL